MQSVETFLQAGMAAHRAGDLARAEAAYREALALAPAHADAHHLLGLVALQQRQLPMALAELAVAVQLSPETAMFHFSLGKAHYAQGDMAAAAEALAQAVARDAQLIAAHVMLANTLLALARHAEAAAAAEVALAQRPEYVPGLVALGTARRLEGRLSAAQAAFRAATRAAPQTFEAWLGLGQTLRGQNDFSAALDALQRADALAPLRHEPPLEIGEIFAGLGQFPAAIEALRRAIARRPQLAAAHLALGAALHGAGQNAEACRAFERAREVDPRLPEAHYNLGVLHAARQEIAAAIAFYEQALALRPDYPAALVNLAESLRISGNVNAALPLARRAVDLSPGHSLVHSALLYAMHFSDQTDAAALLAEHERWAQRHILPVLEKHADRAGDFPNARDTGRRLKVGYLSPDFRDHPVGRHVLQVLEHHDRQSFEVFLYSGVAHPDAFTARCRAAADQVREVAALSDDQLASVVCNDRIDVLVDLSLHMAGNRMPLFAVRPAPVAVSGFGYPSTTGNPAIDLRLSDRFLDPPGAALQGPEKIARLPHSFWCFSPHDDVREAPPAPADARFAGTGAPVTFGSLNNPAKITPAAIDLWADALRATRDSRMLLLCDAETAPELMARFANQAIDPRRIQCVPKDSRGAYLRYYQRIDIVLDPFPYHGHSTSCDALWMGVPVLALSPLHSTSALPVSRAAASLLCALGLDDLVISDRTQWAERAAELARDADRRRALALSLRERMRASPLMDALGYTRALEAIYREAFERWCRC